MRYLLKRCGSQELGSMDASQTPRRGQYLLISKKLLSFFPALSITQLNDYCLIPVYPLYCEDKVYCRFVYHNDKYHESIVDHPRDEYRLYLNREVQGGRLLFHPNGIVILRLVDEEDVDKGVLLDYVDPSQGDYYWNYRNLLSSCLVAKDSYGLYEGIISEFESKVPQEVSIPRDVKIAQQDIAYVDQHPNELKDLFTDVSFRDFLLVVYGKKCAITRTSISYQSLLNLEAAHIRPKAHGGSFLPSNGVLLCRDMHWAFDHGFLALTDDYHILVSKKVTSEALSPYEGKKIIVPSEPFFRPDVESIRWHRKHVFEKFGQIRSL